jgi:hypothetical protein
MPATQSDETENQAGGNHPRRRAIPSWSVKTHTIQVNF